MKKSRQLIGKKNDDIAGNVRINYIYEKGNLARETHISYFDHNQIKNIMIVQNQDTTFQEYEPGEYIEVITGGIPGYVPKIEYYSNGVLKSETYLKNSGEFLIEYEYELRKN